MTIIRHSPRRYVWLFVLLVLPLFGAGCLDWLQGGAETVENASVEVVSGAILDRAETACVKACRTFKRLYPVEMEKGPCIDGHVQADWACDAVHAPRDKTIDDLPDNQCDSFRLGEVNHFVEVDLNCNIVRHL